MAAGAAVLRSVATKMARAPPRLPTSSGGLCLPSRFSTSTGGSIPPSAKLRGPQPQDNKVPSGRAIVGFNEAAPIAASFLFGGFIYVHFIVNPALDRIEADMDAQLQALVTMREEMKKSDERTRAMLLSNNESQTEAAYVYEGQGMENL